MLTGKKIVIIGGTTGIGLSAALAFVKNNAQIICVGRDPNSVKKATTLAIGNAQFLMGDATEEGTSQEAITACIENFGGFDGLYHVAGGSGRSFGDGPLHALTMYGWEETLHLNLTSVMLSNQAAVNQFLKQKTGGSILNMGSVLGGSPSPKHFATHAYAAAKSAITGFSKSIASYYAKNNIRVNVIAPALVETPMAKRAAENETILTFIKGKQPLDGGRIGYASDLDGLALYFMSDYSKFTTGQLIAVDGGWSVSDSN